MHHTLNRWLASSLVALSAITVAHAQGFPEKSVRIIVPYPPGGTTDIVARIAARELSERLKQSFVVDNKAGANGAIGAVEVARSAPDGYTLLMGTASTHGINSAVYKTLPYDAIKDFAPVTIVASTPNIIAVNPSVPAKNLPELIALIKANPGKYNFGSTSQGGTPHMSAELLKITSGLDMVHVPYKGAAPMLTDLIGGQVQIGFDNLPSTINFVRSGKLRAIAVTTSKRWPGEPDIPTIAEAVPGYEVSGWFGLLAPAGTPKDVLNKIQQALAAAEKDAKFSKQMLDLGAQPVANTPEEFAKQIRADVDKWRKVVAASGLQLD